MNGWICAVTAPGAALPPETGGFLAARVTVAGNTAVAAHAGDFAAAASMEPHALRPLLARRGTLLAVGDVRLDNRAEVAAWGGVRAAEASELELVLAAYAARGAECLDRMLGDFALVVWDGERRTLLALRDPFGVKPLFFAEESGLFVFASRLEALARGREFDEEWVADFLVGGAAPPERTVWAGVRAVVPGEALAWDRGRIRSRRFWRAADFAPAAAADEADATERFRALFEEAVRVRMEGGVPVWSDLSGGLDSSSVVSMAQTLAASGRGPALAGTVTVVETMGEGDERRFSDAVVRRYGVRNEQLVNGWAWQDDGLAPAATDEPRSHYAFWARDRELVGRVRGAGGRVLLSGQGADHYLSGSVSYVTDLLAAGQLRDGLRELTRNVVAARQSFWTGLARHGVLPFLPTWLKVLRARPHEQIPRWLDPKFVRRLGVAERLPMVRTLATPRRGSFFAHAMVSELERLPGFLERGPFQEGIEVRYPFLHRPLVEHSLQLPPSMRIRPGVSKYVLRQAMRGILPEEVRTRRRKGTIDSRLLWALSKERPRLDALLHDPEIARRGWVRADALRAATDEARQGESRNVMFLLCALSLETWLAVRSGRWTELAAGTSAAREAELAA
ncbi:MAG TPA: asparagine synthase-related protein [Longimicrobium sp.]|nr:asparagine synthase-related protein [Longimicrobium sp.]